MTVLALLSSLTAVLAVVPTLVALSYPLHALRALRRNRPRREGTRPLSTLVPLRGATESLAVNLDRLLAQRLPAGSEILLCVESEADPAAAVARAAVARAPV